MFSCVALRMSLTSDMGGVSAVPRESGCGVGIVHIFSSYKRYVVVVVVGIRFCQSSSPSRLDPAFSRFAYRLRWSISVFVSCCLSLSSRVPCRFRFSLVVFRFFANVSSEGASFLVRVFVFVRLLASCEVALVGLFVDCCICSVFRFLSLIFV